MIKYLTDTVYLRDGDKEYLRDGEVKEYLLKNDFKGALDRLDIICDDSSSFSRVIKQLVLKCGFDLQGCDHLYQGMFYLIDVTEVIIPENVKYIEVESFCGCDDINIVKIKNKNIQVDELAFSDCKIKYLDLNPDFNGNWRDWFREGDRLPIMRLEA